MFTQRLIQHAQPRTQALFHEWKLDVNPVTFADQSQVKRVRNSTWGGRGRGGH